MPKAWQAWRAPADGNDTSNMNICYIIDAAHTLTRWDGAGLLFVGDDGYFLDGKKKKRVRKPHALMLHAKMGTFQYHY